MARIRVSLRTSPNASGMAKILVIAEKPSVANDIARALGGFTRHDGYFESNIYVLSSAVGHLLELVPPEGVEVKRGKWSFAHLPVIPRNFDLQPIERTERQLKLLVKLLKRKDVAGVINACDAGREGELIFRYIMQHAGNRKPITRLWLQSMTPGAIREGFDKLRKDQEMRPLADAAVCRSESDWLVGINGTLAILVEREERIRKFKPRDFWEVHATFAAASGDYAGRWFDENFPKTNKGDDSEAKPERLWDAKRAAAIRAKCEGKTGVVTEEAKPSTQLSPPLYDLTSLQRDANGRFGFSAKTTLALAQALYEKHKILTYPRTDSRALPEDYLATVRKTFEMFAAQKPSGRAGHAAKILKNAWVRLDKRVFANKEVSDHFA